jgi:hypothetical protein
MKDDIRKLLGGYATGTLTEDERKQLFEAAIHDQQLFEALADEEALKELLEDSAARAELLRATETPVFSPLAVLREWFERPKSKVLAAIGSVLLLTIGIRALLEMPRVDRSTDTVAVTRREPQALQSTPAPETPRATEPRLTEPRPSGSGPLQATPARERQPSAKVRSEALLDKPKVQALKKEADSAPPPPAPLPASADAAERRAEAQPPQQAANAIGATAAAPPPPPVKAMQVAEQKTSTAEDSVTRVARTGELELTYTVLRRNEAGEYLPVPHDYTFAPQDRARVRVTANTRGVLAATGPDERVLGVSISPGAPTVIPFDITFDNSTTRQLDLAFSPTPPGSPVLGFAGGAEPARAARAKTTMRQDAAAEAAQPPAALSVRVTLRRK